MMDFTRPCLVGKSVPELVTGGDCERDEGVAGIAWHPGSTRASGGTERMAAELERRLPADLLGRFQIYPSQVVPPEPGRIQILWTHLNYTAPEFAYLAHGGWRRFHRIVFVSNWQAQGFIRHFGIPWSHCVVMHNAIEPVPVADSRFDLVSTDLPIRLIYTSAPDRGLVILYHVFKKISAERDDVELDVYSSYELYGWEARDREWAPLYDALRKTSRVAYHGAVPNERLRRAMAASNVFAYPSIGLETSCLSLMEAMSAGLVCVHPNYAALYETAANWTAMYQWQDDPRSHAVVFYKALTSVIDALRSGDRKLMNSLVAQKAYADEHYRWDHRAEQWEAFLRDLTS
jgi:UDP-glucose:(glucosyl)LPS alpha-1,2-glucosyltransferase